MIRPIISKITAARLHRRSPRTFGVKAAAANFVMGKAEDHRKTVINAKIADFIALFIVYLHDMLIIAKKQKKCKRDCGILEKSMKQGVHHEKI